MIINIRLSVTLMVRGNVINSKIKAINVYEYNLKENFIVKVLLKLLCLTAPLLGY